MLTHRLIPCLDVRGARVVKGIQFQGLRDAGDPVECAKRYADAGADELVILDVSATLEQRNTAIQTVERVRAVLNIPLTVGGGVRQISDAQRLLDAGADKVAANTAAVDNPELLSALANQFGRQCTILAIDAAQMASGGWEVVTHAGKNRRGISVIDWAQQAVDLGAEILLTSWDKMAQAATIWHCSKQYQMRSGPCDRIGRCSPSHPHGRSHSIRCQCRSGRIDFSRWRIHHPTSQTRSERIRVHIRPC